MPAIVLSFTAEIEYPDIVEAALTGCFLLLFAGMARSLSNRFFCFGRGKILCA